MKNGTNLFILKSLSLATKICGSFRLRFIVFTLAYFTCMITISRIITSCMSFHKREMKDVASCKIHFLQYNICYMLQKKILSIDRWGAMMKKILIVEDEEKLSRVIQLELQYENYETKIANNGKEALRYMQEQTWDLVLLDIMIPELSGLEVLRRVRRTDTITPIILLTARDEVHDKVSGLDLGRSEERRVGKEWRARGGRVWTRRTG